MYRLIIVNAVLSATLIIENTAIRSVWEEACKRTINRILKDMADQRLCIKCPLLSNTTEKMRLAWANEYLKTKFKLSFWRTRPEQSLTALMGGVGCDIKMVKFLIYDINVNRRKRGGDIMILLESLMNKW